jgi:alanine-alpha-ketoisovalerate/valine-pyruvate aminotransferase
VLNKYENIKKAPNTIIHQNLSGCNPIKIPDLLRNHQNIVSLIITHAHLTEIPDLSACVSLEVLDLS